MSPGEQFSAFLTVVTKEIQRFSRIWVQTLLPPVVTTTLYFLVFGQVIGRRIGDMSGFEYIDFIVPGLIMMSVITNSYNNVVSSFYSAKFQKHIEEMLVSPMPVYIMVLGFVVGGVARGLVVAMVVTLVAMFFAELRVEHLWVAVSMAILTATLFALGGLLNGIFAQSFDDISIIPNFVLTPLTYLGGIFYSIQLLPELWQTVSLVNPILYVVNTFRFGLIGITDIPLVPAFAIISLATIGLFLLAIYLLQRGHGIRS